MDGRIYNDNENRKENGKPLLKNPWRVVYRVPDHKTGRVKQTQKRGFKTKNAAQLFLANLQAKISSNDYIQPQNITVEEFMKDWMVNYVDVNCKPNTIDGYRVNVESHIIPGLGKIKLQKLTAMHIEKFYADLLKNGRTDGKGGLSARSIIYIHRNLSQAFDSAVRKRIIGYNPAKDVKPPKMQKFRSNVFSHETILEILEKIKDDDVAAFFSLAALAGLRRGECLGLKWSDIDFENKTLTVQRQLNKTKKGLEFASPKTPESIRVVMISDLLIDVLHGQQAKQTRYKYLLGDDYHDNDLVCAWPNGTPINPSSSERPYNVALLKNGYTPVRFHDLRHSFATYMIRLGVPINVISKMLGHKTVAITMETYVHVLNEMQQEAVEKQNEAFRLAIEKMNADTTPKTEF